MSRRYCWNEEKRIANIEKHGLDFISADFVLESKYRLEIETERNGELRIQVFAYVVDVLAVLTVVCLPGSEVRIISFRHAHKGEREAYHDWLENDYHE